VLNISIDGLCFTTDFDISHESVFNLSFEMKVAGRPSVHVVTPAKIMWHTFDERTSLYTAGVQFLGLKKETKTHLQNVLPVLPPQ